MNGPDRHRPVTREHLDAALVRELAELRGEIERVGRRVVLKLGALAAAEVAVVGSLMILF